jgi:ABC-type cobalamin/Fe3+-siderophores transport system ATPase subunit
MSVAVEVRGVWKSYAAGVRGCSARVWVLRDVSLTVSNGERVGVVGAAGAGKTTLLHCIGGLRRVDAGVVDSSGAASAALLLVDDGDTAEWPAVARRDGAPTMIVAVRSLARLRDQVDRAFLLRDGRLAPVDSPALARRVAERR